jgi:heme/copper-type cytochrome/quinol oxidase subunit 2
VTAAVVLGVAVLLVVFLWPIRARVKSVDWGRFRLEVFPPSDDEPPKR